MFFADGSPEDRVDDWALIACQDYNLGNTGNWFFSFRAGLHGMRSRLSGLAFHRRFVYDWEFHSLMTNLEHHIATMLFCMDSALECLVFALNAFGQAVDKSGFRDVSDEKELLRISPRDVFGPKAIPGWGQIYPTFKKQLVESEPLLAILIDNHDVSKHRQHTFSGGKRRNDAPEGYLEQFGMSRDDPRRFVISPMESVLIPKAPKLPMDDQPSELSEWTTLEALIDDFSRFMESVRVVAAQDALKNIILPIPELRAPH